MNANIINQRQPPPYSQNSKELLYTIASSSNNAFYACCTTTDTSNMFNYNNVIQTTNVEHYNSSNAIQTNISACVNENFLLKSLQLPNFTAYPTNSLVISKENYQSPNKVIPQISMDTEAAIALRAARMVDMLAKENESLRKSLEQNERKLVQMQKLEMALENTQKGHDMLIQTNEKREQLERIVRTKLESENTLLKQQNIQLLEHVNLLQKENQLTAYCANGNNNKSNLALGSQGNLTTHLTERLLNLPTNNHPDIVTNKTNSANDIAYAYGLNNVANRNRTNSTTFGMNNCNNHLIELEKKEVIISQLITQNREMLTLNEKKNFEVSTLKATLNEQTSQLEVLQKALLQAQTNVLRLEEIISSLADHFPPFIRKLLKDQLSLPQLDSANNQANCIAGDNINNMNGSPNNLLLSGPHKSSSSVFKESLLGSHNSVESPHNNNNMFGRSWQNVAQSGIPNMLGMEDSLSTMRIYNTLITNNTNNNNNNCNQTNDFSNVGNQQPSSDTNLFTNFYYDYQDKLLCNQKGSSPQTILPPTTKHYLSHKPCSDTNLPSNLYELNNSTNCFNKENQKVHNGNNNVGDNIRNSAKNQELHHLCRRTSCFVLPSNISKTAPYNINQSLSLNNFSEGVSIENAPKSNNVNKDLPQLNDNQVLGRNWEIRDKFQGSQFDTAQKEAMITELLNGTKFNTRRTMAPNTTITTNPPSYSDKNISAPNISLVDGSNNGILVNNNPKNGRYIKCPPFRTNNCNTSANPLSPSSRLDLESIRKIFLPKTSSSSQHTSLLEPQTPKLVNNNYTSNDNPINNNCFSDIKIKVGMGHRESLPPISPKYLGFLGKSPSSLTVSEVQNLGKETEKDSNGIMHKKQLTKSNLDILNSVSTQSQTILTSSNNSSASSPGKKSKIMSFELKSRIWKI